MNWEKIDRAKTVVRSLSFKEYGELSQWTKRYENRIDWSRKKE